jgi:hypothetical protein
VDLASRFDDSQALRIKGLNYDLVELGGNPSLPAEFE